MFVFITHSILSDAGKNVLFSQPDISTNERVLLHFSRHFLHQEWISSKRNLKIYFSNSVIDNHPVE